MMKRRTEQNKKPGERSEVPEGRDDGRVKDRETGYQTNMLRVPKP